MGNVVVEAAPLATDDTTGMGHHPISGLWSKLSQVGDVPNADPSSLNCTRVVAMGPDDPVVLSLGRYLVLPFSLLPAGILSPVSMSLPVAPAGKCSCNLAPLVLDDLEVYDVGCRPIIFLSDSA